LLIVCGFDQWLLIMVGKKVSNLRDGKEDLAENPPTARLPLSRRGRSTTAVACQLVALRHGLDAGCRTSFRLRP
jgi:hypothetical protein